MSPCLSPFWSRIKDSQVLKLNCEVTSLGPWAFIRFLNQSFTSFQLKAPDLPTFPPHSHNLWYVIFIYYSLSSMNPRFKNCGWQRAGNRRDAELNQIIKSFEEKNKRQNVKFKKHPVSFPTFPWLLKKISLRLPKNCWGTSPPFEKTKTPWGKLGQKKKRHRHVSANHQRCGVRLRSGEMLGLQP